MKRRIFDAPARAGSGDQIGSSAADIVHFDFVTGCRLFGAKLAVTILSQTPYAPDDLA